MKQERCLYCFENIQNGLSFHDWLRQDDVICGKCKSKLHVLQLDTQLEKMPLHILYEYNETMESMIFQMKEGRDIALAPVFFHSFRKKIIDRYRHSTIVLLPSSKEKYAERGFQPVKEMLKGIPMNIVEPFYKSENHKQSLQSFEERVHIDRIIQRDYKISLPKTPLLLLDDVCTSGSSLKRAYDLIKEHTYKIEALVLCAHPLFVESCDKKGLRHRKSFSILETVVRNGR